MYSFDFSFVYFLHKNTRFLHRRKKRRKNESRAGEKKRKQYDKARFDILTENFL